MTDWRSLYPFASQYLSVGGFRYHYVDEGSGPPVLFVHGNPCWSFHWRDLIQAVRQSNRAIAVDHLGCGLSDKPQDWSYRLDDHIRNLLHLVTSLDLRGITLVAQDWGGAIGLGAAVRAPERFSRLVLYNTAAFRADAMPLRIRLCRMPVLGSLAVRGANAFVRAALTMTLERPERLNAAARAGILAPYDCWTNRVAIDRFVKDIPMSARHPSYRTLAELEERLPVLADRPVQLVWGMRDWCFTPAFLERFRAIFPGAEVHRLDDAAHWVVEDATERVAGLLLGFLGRTSPEPAAFAAPNS